MFHYQRVPSINRETTTLGASYGLGHPLTGLSRFTLRPWFSCSIPSVFINVGCWWLPQQATVHCRGISSDLGSSPTKRIALNFTAELKWLQNDVHPSIPDSKYVWFVLDHTQMPKKKHFSNAVWCNQYATPKQLNRKVKSDYFWESQIIYNDTIIRIIQ
jgi:hypothetical protein